MHLLAGIMEAVQSALADSPLPPASSWWGSASGMPSAGLPRGFSRPYRSKRQPAANSDEQGGRVLFARRVDNLQIRRDMEPRRDGHIVKQLDAVFGAEAERLQD